MPSSSPTKYRGPVVRQLSLQNQTPLQSPAGHRKLKKQLSEDDTRVLETVEVTGQGWLGGNERPEAVLRIGSGEAKAAHMKVTGIRPKPVKVAWAERKQESTESPPSVEVVATKCQGQPRPMSVKAQRLRNPLLGNKDTLVYSKLQLAERLRNAWSEREKIKPNLNIFLAQGSETTRSDNDPTSERPSGETASTLSDSVPIDKKRKAMQVRAFSQDLTHPSIESSPTPYRLKLEANYFPPDPGQPSNEDKNDDEMEPNSTSITEDKSPDDSGRYLQELNRIEVRVTKIESSKNSTANEIKDEEPVDVKRCRNKENFGMSCDASSDNPSESLEGSDVERPSAQDRRASFRRSTILHKTITESFTSRSPKDEDGKLTEVGEEVKLPLKPSLKKPPLVRAFSAPSQNNDVLDAHKIASQQKKVKIAPPKKLQPTVSFDIPVTSSEEVAAMRERIKSAPIRRKLKTAAARRKNKDKDSSDEEKEIKETANASKKTTRRNHGKAGADIVTMVSLVSPAASDTEDSVINLPIESFRAEDKEDTERSSNSSSRNAEEAKNASAFVQKFMSLRKATKSVSFQPHPVLNRSYSASFPSRRAPAGTPIVIPTPVISNPALTPAQILERDKRPFSFSGVTVGNDGRGIKRRLLRSSTEAPKEEDDFQENQKPNTQAKNSPDVSSNLEKEEEVEEKSNGEPEFKSPKEKECWNLYQKMLQKGVSVSFDTVLRGMLTPTEYRLRKNSLLSNC